ncbi:hypothetical protein Pla8534_57870 [Lignipirellula cremea]|uniref:Uncharacterized protein n=1 Tax=Lignipirellula cremea TaxID=2528010 RepID=A0A518E1F9_9BACT|nr:hypothetical protein Pla8534_57870 [Lignipirellula cremea]
MIQKKREEKGGKKPAAAAAVGDALRLVVLVEELSVGPMAQLLVDLAVDGLA